MSAGNAPRNAPRADPLTRPPRSTRPSRGSRPRLEVQDLEVRVGGSGPDVVSEISFSVRGGEVLDLIGKSGSGKTTVALALLGHVRAGLRISAGKVCLDGTDVLALSPGQLREVRGAKISYVPQD